VVTNPTKIWDVLGLFLIAAVGTWLLVRVFYGSFPPIPVYAGASLYLVAVVEVVTAVIVRNRIAEHRVGTGLHDLHPLTVFRALVLASSRALLSSPPRCGSSSAAAPRKIGTTSAPDNVSVPRSLPSLCT
jgi:hypothetical protein